MTSDAIFEPPGWPLAGHLFAVMRDPLGLLMEGMRSGRPLVRYRFGPVRYVLVNDPEDVGQVLRDPEHAFGKSASYDALRLILGQGLLTSEGELWRRQRKLMQPAFHHRRLVGFVDQMSEVTEAFIDGLIPRADGRIVDVHTEMMALTFRVVGRTLFSMDVSDVADEVGAALHELLAFAANYTESIVKLPTWMPTPRHRRFRRAMSVVDGVVGRLVDARHRDLNPPADLLAALMHADMSDQQRRDELVTLALAGHETTANALTWIWALLSRHPDVAARVRQEVASEVGDRRLDAEALSRLALTERVVLEAMRLYPPAWGVERTVRKPARLSGVELRLGDVLLVCQYTLHRDPRFWPDPDRFDPDRFIPELVDARPRFVYVPFGGGPRICIGKVFAVMEAKLILAAMIRRLVFTLPAGFRIDLDPGVTLRPRRGLRMTMAKATRG